MRKTLALFLVVGLFAGCLPDKVPGPGPNPPGRKLEAVVIVLENRADPLPSGVVAAMDSAAVQGYLNSHVKTAADGKTPESKRYPKKIDLSKQSGTVQKLHSAIVSKMDTSGDPFIGVAVTEKRFIVSKVPAGFESDGKTSKLLTWLKKYGGE